MFGFDRNLVIKMVYTVFIATIDVLLIQQMMYKENEHGNV